MLAYLFVGLAVLWRLAPQSVFPHPHNFTPALASLLFFGSRIPRKWLWVPVLLLAATDLILDRHYGFSFTYDLPITWAWYIAMVWFGGLLKRDHKPVRLAAAALSGSISFFLLSNFGVWAVWNMYPKTLSGLTACYAAGIPFFRSTLTGDILFTAVFFSVPLLVRLLSPARSDGHIPAA